MMMNDKDLMLSFCIPVYNNSRATELLIRHLLSCDSPNFQVVVCDDCSTDDTINILSKLKDSRLKILTNKSRLGAKLNWSRAIKSGDGKYAYLVMGRDWLDSRKIPTLIDLLEECKNVDLIMDRKCKGKVEILGGVEALKYFLKPDHPTGIILKKDALEKVDNLDAIFDTNMAYPECILKNEILNNNPFGAIVNSGVFTYQVTINKAVVTSNFEHNSIGEPYFFLSRRIEEFCSIIDLVDNHSTISLNYADELYFYFFRNVFLPEITYEFKSSMENYEQASHYRLKKRYVSPEELIGHVDNAIKCIKGKDFFEIGNRKQITLECANAFIDKIKKSDLSYNIYRKESISRLLSRIIQNKNKGLTIFQEFQNKNIKSVVIYGYSLVGEVILSELKKTGIQVLYGVDVNWKYIYSEIPIISLDDVEADPFVDIVIVSLIDEIDKIIMKLRDKFKKSEIVSIEEIVYKMEGNKYL